MYQDVRMFIVYVYEKHGNPLRRTALSALTAQTYSFIEEKTQIEKGIQRLVF